MKASLLLVVNNQRESDSLSKILEHEFRVFTARNVKEMWHVVDGRSVQLIICSTDLPVNSGLEVCMQLKSTFHYSHIPVILIGGENGLQAKIRSLEAGADASIGKPYSPHYLKAQIKNLIANRLKWAEHFTHFPVGTIGVTSTMSTDGNDQFLKRLNHFLFDHVRTSNFHVDLLAKHMNMSRPTLYRKIRNITDLTPNQLINLARLKQAAKLLSSGNYKVFEVAHMVGFHSQSSFGKAFMKQYNVTPTAYRHMKKTAGSPIKFTINHETN